MGCELTNSCLSLYLSLCKDSGRLFEDDVGVHMTDLIYELNLETFCSSNMHAYGAHVGINSNHAPNSTMYTVGITIIMQ